MSAIRPHVPLGTLRAFLDIFLALTGNRFGLLGPKNSTLLGPGLLESVYEVVLAHELVLRGYLVERQVAIAVQYDSLVFDVGFRADLVVDGLVIVELKSVEALMPVHKKQVLTYIKLAKKRLGLLINFGSSRIKDGITRLVCDLPD